MTVRGSVRVATKGSRPATRPFRLRCLATMRPGRRPESDRMLRTTSADALCAASADRRSAAVFATPDIIPLPMASGHRSRLPPRLRSFREPAGRGRCTRCSPRVAWTEFGPGRDRLPPGRSGRSPLHRQDGRPGDPGLARRTSRMRSPSPTWARAKCWASSRCSRARRAPRPRARPEQAELFTLEKAVFLDLMKTLPAFARQPLPRAGQAPGGHDAQAAAGLVEAAPGQPEVLRPRHRDPDPHRLAPDGQPDGDPGGRQAEGGRDLLLQGQHRQGARAALSAATTPSSSSSSRRSRASSPSPGATCRRRRCRPTSPCPPSRCSWSRCGCRTSCPCCRTGRAGSAARVFRQKASQLTWEDAETVELAAVGLVAPQEGRVHERAAAGRCRAARTPIYKTVLALIESRPGRVSIRLAPMQRTKRGTVKLRR